MVIGDWALVGVEMLTVPESLQREVQAAVGETPRVLLIATHTHCAPDSQMLNDRMTMQLPGIASFSRRTMMAYAEKIAESVRQAMANRSEVTRVNWSQQQAPWVRGRRALAAPDTRSTRLSLHTQRGRLTLDTFSAHPTLFDETELQTRGDWPGEWMTLSGGLVATSGLGDASPSVPGTNPLLQAKELAAGLQALMSSARERPLQQVPRWGQVSVPLGEPVAHPEFATSVGLPEAMAQGLVLRFAPEQGTVTALAFGNVLWLFLSAEPTADFARAAERVGAIQGFARTVVVAHAGGWAGYLLMPQDYKRGGYEATLSFHGAGAADRWLRAIDQATGLLWLNQRPTPEIEQSALHFAQNALGECLL